VFFIFNFSACSQHQLQQKTSITSPQPVVPFSVKNQFGPRPSLINTSNIYQLSDSQKQKFIEYFESPAVSWLKPNKRIYKYLQRYVENYNFLNQTLTAEQSLSQSQGNCLSLAILTTALANTAGVETGYQLVQSAPVYQKEGNIILSSQHIRSLLFEPQPELETGQISLGQKGLIVDYFPSKASHIRRQVNSQEFSAMYYRNKAADAIIDKNYDLAYWLLRETLKYIPNDENSINMMAVVHENKGLSKQAELLYRHGIKYAQNKLDLLRNYQIFLKKEHRLNDAKKIKSQLNSMNVINPFDWVDLGHTAFEQKKYSEARRYYKRAVRAAPYLHQALMGVAKSEFKLGNLRAAKIALNAAKENAFDAKTKSLYSAKMVMLRKQQ